jgi:hypothetical protein
MFPRAPDLAHVEGPHTLEDVADGIPDEPPAPEPVETPRRGAS